MGDIMIGGLLVAAVIAAYISMRKNKKKGRSCGDCSGCSGCSYAADCKEKPICGPESHLRSGS